MGPVGGRSFGGSVKFADGNTSSANVPHLNVWGFDISAAEFPQQKKTRVFGVNRPLVDLNGKVKTRHRLALPLCQCKTKTPDGHENTVGRRRCAISFTTTKYQ